MQRTEENIAWAMAELRKLDHLPGCPTSDESWLAMADDLMDIFRDDDEPQTEIDEVEPRRSVDTKGMKKSEWTMKQIRMTCRKFPTLFQIRKIYGTHWRPADRQWPSDILARMEDD